MMGIVPIVAHSTEPARYAVMDIETADADESAVAVAKELLKAPKNWKAETVERKRPEREAAIERKAALLDASPITCLSLKTDRIAVLFNGMGNDSFDIPGWVVLPCQDEKGLLMTLRVLLNASTCQSTELVGQNFGFDIGKLRNAYMRHRLYLPCALMPGDGSPPMFDLMRQIRYFSTEYHNEPFVSLEVIARILGLPQPKQVIKGADCPRLYKEGRYQEILIYNAIDAETTERAYLLMTGNAPDLA
jgi:hypothetical protein